MASPVVAGCVALLASSVPAARRWDVLNPASMKQALVEGAERLPGMNMFEQGNGRVTLAAAEAVLASYAPRASLVPAKLDFTDCPYAWPYCRQGVYAFGLPLAFNATILNGMGATGRLAGPPVFEAADEGGRLLSVTFTWSEVLWPWSGFLGVFVEVGWVVVGVGRGAFWGGGAVWVWPAAARGAGGRRACPPLRQGVGAGPRPGRGGAGAKTPHMPTHRPSRPPARPRTTPSPQVSPAAWNYTGTASGEVVFTVTSPPPWGSDVPRSSTVGGWGAGGGQFALRLGGGGGWSSGEAQLTAQAPFLPKKTNTCPTPNSTQPKPNQTAKPNPPNPSTGARPPQGADHPHAPPRPPRAVGPAPQRALPAGLHPPRQPRHKGGGVGGFKGGLGGWGNSSWGIEPWMFKVGGYKGV